MEKKKGYEIVEVFFVMQMTMLSFVTGGYVHPVMVLLFFRKSKLLFILGENGSRLSILRMRSASRPSVMTVISSKGAVSRIERREKARWRAVQGS